MIPTKEENPNGLHLKYYISKVDGTPIDPEAEYFILRLDENATDLRHVNACRQAICTYAKAMQEFLPELANDLLTRYKDPV